MEEIPEDNQMIPEDQNVGDTGRLGFQGMPEDEPEDWNAGDAGR